MKRKPKEISKREMRTLLNKQSVELLDARQVVEQLSENLKRVTEQRDNRDTALRACLWHIYNALHFPFCEEHSTPREKCYGCSVEKSLRADAETLLEQASAANVFL